MKNSLSRIVLPFFLVVLLAAALTEPAMALSVTASSAIAMDYETGEVLYSKDIDTMRVPASMTKIMTAYIVYEELAAGNLTKDSMLTVSPAAAAMSRNSNYPMAVPLTSGGSYSVDELLRLIMVPSASASCLVLAENISGSEEAFVERMNETAANIGLSAQYQNCHGALPHYISARSVASLIRNFIRDYPDILNYTSLTSITFNGITYANTNRLLSSDYYYEGADGFKTGTIAAAGYCLSATAVRDGRRIITVVMNSSNTNTRHTDSRAILDYGFEELARRDASRATTQLTVASAPEEIRIGADFEVKIRVEGVSAGYEADSACFIVDGREVKSFDSLTVSDGLEFTLLTCLSERENPAADIRFVLRPAVGAEKEILLSVPISGDEPALYRDVSGHWAEAAIEVLSGKGVFQGEGAGYFYPDKDMTRSMFVTILGRAAEGLGVEISQSDEKTFDDVPPDAWYAKYVSWAAGQGIVEGYGAAFGSDDFITREQASAMFDRFLSVYGDIADEAGEAFFTDSGSISDWALDSVSRIARAGLIQGYPDGSFRPAAGITRAEAAVIVCRFTLATN